MKNITQRRGPIKHVKVNMLHTMRNHPLLTRINEDNLLMVIDCQEKDIMLSNGRYKYGQRILEIELDRNFYHEVVQLLPEWWSEWSSPGACYLSEDLIDKIKQYLVNPPVFDFELYDYILGMWQRSENNEE